jgi:hypothetical protein
MPDQGMGLVLCQHTDTTNAGVDAVGQREIDDPELTAEEDGGFCSPTSQFMQTRATATRQYQGQGITGQSGNMSGVAFEHQRFVLAFC